MLNIIRKTIVVIVATVTLATAAFAERNSNPKYLTEIESCITELKSRIDTTGVYRIRYIVTKSRKAGSRFVLSFQTSVFAPSGESLYMVYCVTNGSAAPFKFELEERGNRQ